MEVVKQKKEGQFSMPQNYIATSLVNDSGYYFALQLNRKPDFPCIRLGRKSQLALLSITHQFQEGQAFVGHVIRRQDARIRPAGLETI